jgi:hypothetical protein
MKKVISILMVIFMTSGILYAVTMDLLVKPVDTDRLRFFPVTADNKNYFFPPVY